MIAFFREIVRVLNEPCRSHSMMMSASLDGRLPRATRIGLWLHTMICKPCRTLFAQFTFLHGAAKRLGREAQGRILRSDAMPEEVRDRLTARLRGR